MTQYVEGATVYHLIRHLDHHRNEATTRCGREGEPVEADPDEDELCRDCLDDGSGQRPHPDDLDDDHAE
mgnify:CR=1 FL=1